MAKGFSPALTQLMVHEILVRKMQGGGGYEAAPHTAPDHEPARARPVLRQQPLYGEPSASVPDAEADGGGHELDERNVVTGEAELAHQSW